MDWRVKALIQRGLGVIPLGRAVNGYSRTYLNLRRPVSEKVRRYRECSEGHLALLANAGLAVAAGHKILELGTGKNLTPATLLAVHGIDVVTVDTVAQCQWTQVQQTIEYLKQNPDAARLHGISAPRDFEGRIDELAKANDLADYCRRAGIVYVAPYDISELERGAYGQFDVTLSYFVMEHIPEPDLRSLMRALYRSTIQGGRGTHIVDLQDHFGWGFLRDKNCSYLNFRKYSPEYWNFFAGGALSYVNRLMPSDYSRLFVEAGFDVLVRDEQRWDGEKLPVDSEQIHPVFRDSYSPDELWIRKIHYVLG